MASPFTIQLVGFDALDRRLKALRPKIERQVFRKTLRGMITKIARKMKAGTPRITGSARRSVKGKVRVRRGGAYASIRYTKRPAAQMRWREHGTRRQPARPFFRQSVGSWSDEAVRDFSKNLKQAVEKAEVV